MFPTRSFLFHFSSTQHQLRFYKFALPSLVKDCASRLNITHGKRIHAAILHLGLHSDPYVASSLITLYSKCGLLADASHVFAQLPRRDATVWNSLVAGNFRHNHFQEGLARLRQMQMAGISPDAHSLSILLKACSNGGLGLHHGRQVHAFLLTNALNGDAFALTGLIHMYSKAGDLSAACKVFDGISDEKAISMWNAVISGFCHNGLWDRSLELFALMRCEGFELRPETASCILAACAMIGAGGSGKGIHCCAIKMGFESDSYVCTSMITLYARIGLMDEVFRIFDSAPSKEVQLWNSLLSALISNSCTSQALDVYDEMRFANADPDSVTITNVLSACSSIGQPEFGRKIHGLLIKRPDLSTMAARSSLISMYMRIGDANDAALLFSSVKEPDFVMLGAMISGFCHNKHYDHALQMFSQLRADGFNPDSGLVASIISACAAMNNWSQLGFQTHCLAVKNGTESDSFSESALINMYCKCGLPLSARSIFAAASKKSLPVWNSLISGYSHSGLLGESIGAFVGIAAQGGLLPDSVSINSVLVSVSALAALSKGKMIHGYLVRNEIFCDEIVQNSFIDMYMKCGCLRYAQAIFDKIPVRNIVAWNTMMAGYGFHGHCLKAVDLFDEMRKSEVVPDGTSYLSLISSCSHSGLVAEGRRLYDSMINDHGIMPSMEHFANMVDLFGRAGWLDEAYCFIRAMPVEPDESIWQCFLSACRSHRASELGVAASDQLISRKPRESGSYAQVVNFYGEMGFRDKAASIRVRMKEEGMPKKPGCSWIEVVDRVCVFHSGDSSSPLTAEIHASLKSLQRSMKLADTVESM